MAPGPSVSKRSIERSERLPTMNALMSARNLPRLATIAAIFLIAARAGASAESFSADDYYRVDKIDVHFHIRTEDPQFVTLAKQDRFRFVNIATYSADPDEMRLRHRAAFAQLEAHPDRVIVASSFPTDGWDEPDWQDRTIQYLDETFSQARSPSRSGRTLAWNRKTRMAK